MSADRPRACASTSSSDAAPNARADEAIPPPRRAISSYGTPVTFSSYSSARHPANGRGVWQATKPGRTRAPVPSARGAAGRVDAQRGGHVGLEAGDPVAVQRDGTAVEYERPRPVGAQVGKAVR